MNRYYRRHHYFRNSAIIILLLAIGAGGDYYYYHQSNSSQPIQQSSRQASQGQSSHKPMHQSLIHRTVNKVNRVKQSVSHSQPANKPGYTLSVLPKNLQDTWYSYDNDGKLDTLVITPNKIIDNGHTQIIHARPMKFNALKAANHSSWSIAIPYKHSLRGQHFTDILGWN